MKLKHTPGPWKAVKTEDVESRLDILIQSEDNIIIGWAYRDETENARLIAAAPEMLEALKNWNKSFGDSLRFQDYHVNVFDALNKRYIESKKIIEKATGLPIEEVIL